MMKKWIIAFGSVLALTMLTLPILSRVGIQPFTLFEKDVKIESTCDAESRLAPMDFTLKDMNGEDFNFSSLRGSVVLLNFWATWCGPCKVEIPGFVELQDEYGDQGFQVLGVSVDDRPEQIRLFAKEFSVNYPMLVGLGEEDFKEAYGPIWGLPISIWIDREGTQCKTHLGIASKEDFTEVLKSML